MIFVTIFVKNGKLQIQSRFPQTRKKIFDFSGRFPESSNDCLSLELQPYFFNSIATRRKIASKQQGSQKLMQ
jgi:hypothetical protein